MSGSNPLILVKSGQVCLQCISLRPLSHKGSKTWRCLIDVKPNFLSRQVTGLSPNQPTYRILVVEDRWENRHLLVNVLKPLGFEVREAENGKQALDLWETWHPHLIWMDMRMPVMDGYEATRRIREQERVGKQKSRGAEEQGRWKLEHGEISNAVEPFPFPPEPETLNPTPDTRPLNPDPRNPTKILALTASAFEESRSAVEVVGCDDFVRKPFKQQDILDKMGYHLGVEYEYQTLSDGNGTSRAGSLEDRVKLKPPVPQPEAQSEFLRLLEQMPSTWIGDIREAAIEADSDWLHRLIEEISASEDLLSNYLKSLTEQFEFDTILDLLENRKK